MSRGTTDHDFWAERGLYAHQPDGPPEPMSRPDEIITVRSQLPSDYEARREALARAVEVTFINDPSGRVMARALDFYAFLMGPNYRPEPKDTTDVNE